MLCAQQGHIEEALALLGGLVATGDHDAGLLKDHALVLAGAGRNEDALAAFDRAWGLMPADLELASCASMCCCV